VNEKAMAHWRGGAVAFKKIIPGKILCPEAQCRSIKRNNFLGKTSASSYIYSWMSDAPLLSN
jgi:hypothetical protein